MDSSLPYLKQAEAVEDVVRQQNEWRLRQCFNLIASENVMSERSRRLLASDFSHRYAEGHPGARYYEGTDWVDWVETRVKESFQTLFSCPQAEVRTISGTMSNDAVFRALLRPNDPVLVHSLSSGGHISHQTFGAMGKYTANINFFPTTGPGYTIDVEKTKDVIRSLKPRLVVFGKSMFLFPDPLAPLREVCEEQGSMIMFDGAHVLGLIAGKQFQDPLREGAVVLNGSTHKTFFGPQRGVILGRMDEKLWSKVDKAAFPGATSNHHLNTLPPLYLSAMEMMAFGAEYGRQVIQNSQALAQEMHRLGLDVEGRDLGFTRSHQVVVDVSRFGGGGVLARLLRQNDIIVNRNLLPHDPPRNLSNPSGIRLGVQEMTRFGMKEADMKEMARVLRECIVDRADVREEVHRLRAPFSRVLYSFDSTEIPTEPRPSRPVPLAGRTS